jgi:hypothetical protein
MIRCMIPLPWKSMAKPIGGKDYVAMVSFLLLKQYRLIPKFLLLTFETQRQLARSSGLVGYSVYAELLKKRFWTLSVWQDNQSLMDFVAAVPHGRIMQQLAPHMGTTRFEQWTASAAEIPLKWPAARARVLAKL